MENDNNKCDRCGREGDIFSIPFIFEKGIKIRCNKVLCKEHLDEYLNLIRNKLIPDVRSRFKRNKDGKPIENVFDVKTRIIISNEEKKELINYLNKLYKQYTTYWFTYFLSKEYTSSKEKYFLSFGLKDLPFEEYEIKKGRKKDVKKNKKNKKQI